MVTDPRSDERGVALILALFLSLVIAGVATGVIVMAGNSNLIAKFHANEAMMEMAADGGLELGRDTLNGNAALIPVGQGHDTLQANAVVRDANGVVIPGFTRSIYAGPNGDTTGQFGEFASVISVISNPRGAVVVRRIQLKQDSFSRFARFFNTWQCCMWGNNEVVFGPVHSNQGMAVQTGAPGATFWGPVTVVTSVTNQASANWNGGITTGAPPITFPTTQTLTNLQNFATTSQTVFTGWGTVTDSTPDTRIEFVAIDLNNDGDSTDADEGFFRVFRANAGGSATVQQQRRYYVTGRDWIWGNTGTTTYPTGTSASTDPNIYSPNCGAMWGGNFRTADSIYTLQGGTTANKVAAVRGALTSASRRCYAGGDRRLYFPNNQYRLSDPWGTWQTWAGWGGNPPAALVNKIQAQGVAAGFTASQIAQTFVPLSRNFNVNFKGIIYVNGAVGLSGLLRGRVTVVTTGNVMLLDDITYTTAPGTNCYDILGVLTQQNVYISDNTVNGIMKVNNNWVVQFDESTNETFNGFFLSLGYLKGENYSPAVSESQLAPEACAGGSRGCKVLVGGSIQQGVAATYSSRGGWAEADTYDQCGVTNPPPYYPTTGRFTKNRYYEMDPVGFDVATWFLNNQ